LAQGQELTGRKRKKTSLQEEKEKKQKNTLDSYRPSHGRTCGCKLYRPPGLTFSFFSLLLFRLCAENLWQHKENDDQTNKNIKGIKHETPERHTVPPSKGFRWGKTVVFSLSLRWQPKPTINSLASLPSMRRRSKCFFFLFFCKSISVQPGPPRSPCFHPPS
jgi:hypothetical protein